MKIVRKILLIGDKAVGKSTYVLSGIVEKFAYDIKGSIGGTLVFDETGHQLMPINGGTGSYIWEKNVNVGEKEGIMYFYELPASKYGSLMIKNMLKGAFLILLCYDQNFEESFNNLEKWMTLIKKWSDPQTKIALIGLKGDLENMISVDRVAHFVKKYEIEMELKVSSKNMENIRESFKKIGEILIKLE